MLYIGIDIGTTTISGLLIDGTTGEEIARKTIKNTAHVQTDAEWKRLQSPESIVETCQALIGHFYSGYDGIRGIGLTGQMHGILYVDGSGKACGDLVSWQDERGNLLADDGRTYCQKMQDLTGRSAATGFGLTTLYFDTVNGLVPDEAVCVCTIADYVAMRLTGRKTPLIHSSNAASLGLFSLTEGDFEREKIKKLGIDTELLPQVSTEECVIGETENKLAVTIPIGDNQASFLGAVGCGTNTLINIGTGSQISRLSRVRREIEGLECRPYVNNTFLLAGASLCGGSSYNLLVNLFTDTVRLFTGLEPTDIIKKMDQAAADASGGGAALRVDTCFRGTRSDAEKRGAIYNIGVNNFTPGNLCYAFLEGICEELREFYDKMKPGQEPEFFAISGNAARNSGILREIAQRVFEKEVRVPTNAEEAAHGAAMLAIYAVEHIGWEQITRMVRYQ